MNLIFDTHDKHITKCRLKCDEYVLFTGTTSSHSLHTHALLTCNLSHSTRCNVCNVTTTLVDIRWVCLKHVHVAAVGVFALMTSCVKSTFNVWISFTVCKRFTRVFSVFIFVWQHYSATTGMFQQYARSYCHRGIEP